MNKHQMANLLVREEKGNLPILLFWQSLGRWPVFETFSTYKAATQCAERLERIGRTPALYWQIKPEAEEKKEEAK